MLVNEEKCIGCGKCIPFCPVGAISLENKKAIIDQGQCLECGDCIRNEVIGCPTRAIYEMPDIYETSRGIRRFFSDPTTTHAVTKVPGRGTEEVKTNDVTGRVEKGEFGVAIEMGRPCLGTSLASVEKMTMALASLGVIFEEANPLTQLMSDKTRGIIAPQYKTEKLVSAIIEFTISDQQLIKILSTVKKIAQELDTVFSLDLISCYDDAGKIPALPVLAQLGITPRVNSKVNLGLGRK